jgi:phenylalanyl-tRNA synthetase alpha subunit
VKELRAAFENARHALVYATLFKQLRALSAKVITKEILKSTEIGKIVNKLSSLEAPESRGDLKEEARQVRAIAKEILEDWKRMVEKSKKKAAAPKEGAKPVLTAATSEERKEEAKRLAMVQVKLIVRENDEPYIPRAFKIDLVDKHRNKMLHMFIKYLQRPSELIPMNNELVLTAAAKKAA